MKHNKLSLSIVTRLFSGSSVSRKGGALSRCKTLRLEPLEDRRLLDAASGGDEPELPEPPISEEEFSAIRTSYSNLSILPDPEELGNINVLVVDLSEGANSAANLSALKTAIDAANETPLDDLIVVRTGPTKGTDTSDNTITFSSAADELSISLSEDNGSLTIVSWGTDSSGALIPLTLNANSKSRVASISGSGAFASLGGFVFLNGDSAKSASNKNSGGALYVDASASVYLENLTIKDCKADSGQGGGIDNNGMLFLYNSTFSGNSANKGGGVNFGSSTSTAIIKDCFFNANESNFGAGLFIDASNLSVEKSSFSDNIAKNDGGAIFNAGSNLAIESASICNNQAANGAGIYNEGTAGISNSLISANIATANGAGIYNEGTADISNSLISANIATANGGGIYLGGDIGYASLYSSTIASNQAANGGGIYSENDNNNCMAVNSIIALNSVTSSDNNSTADLYGSSYNYTGTNCLVGHGSLLGGDIGQYVDGGPLFTDAANGDYTLVEGSPAIEKGDNDLAEDIAYDLAGNERRVGNNVDLGAYEYQTAVTPTLAAPDGLAAVAESANSVSVSWTEVSDASYYVLERSADSENWTTAAQSLTTNVFVDSSLTSGTRYYYRVQAVNAQISSQFSAPVSVYTKPGQVTNLDFLVTSTSSIQLSWTAVTGANGYRVERSVDNQNWTTLSDNFSGTTYNNTGLESLTTYYYRVAANNPSGIGEYSQFVSITTALNAPDNLDAAASSDSTIIISWDSIAKADKYVVERYNGSDWTTLDTLIGQNSTSYTDTDLTAATEYQYRVKAISGTSSSAYETISCYTKTEKPQNLSVKVLNSSQAVLTWDNVSGADRYTVWFRQYQEEEQVVEYQPILCTSNVITLSDLTGSSDWEAFIEAINEGGSVSTDSVFWRTDALQNSGLTDAQVLTKQRAQSQNRGILFVNTLEDSVTLNPNDGWITLREAIAYAGTEGWGTTIQFNVSGTITLARQALTISKSLSILADGVVIDACRQSSGLSLEGTTAKPITVTLAGVTVENGLSTAAGGGIACWNSTLNVANSAVLNNEAATFGGGLYADHSTIILVNSTVSNNQTTGTDSQGGGAYGDTGSKILVSSSIVTKNLSASVESDFVSANGSSGIVDYNSVIGETYPSASLAFAGPISPQKPTGILAAAINPGPDGDITQENLTVENALNLYPKSIFQYADGSLLAKLDTGEAGAGVFLTFGINDNQEKSGGSVLLETTVGDLTDGMTLLRPTDLPSGTYYIYFEMYFEGETIRQYFDSVDLQFAPVLEVRDSFGALNDATVFMAGADLRGTEETFTITNTGNAKAVLSSWNPGTSADSPFTFSAFDDQGSPVELNNLSGYELECGSSVTVCVSLDPSALDENSPVSFAASISAGNDNVINLSGLAVKEDSTGTIGETDANSTVSIASQRQNVYTVKLNSKPKSNVVVVLDAPDGLTTSVRALTFTPSNWDVPQTVHVGLALNSTLEQGSNQAIRHATLSSDTTFLSKTVSDVLVSLTSDASETLDAAGVLVLPANHKTNYNLAAQTALPAEATSLTDWDAFYQEIWVESVGLAAGATITKTLSYDPRLFDVASDACLIAADGVEGSFTKNSINESQTEITLTLTVNDPLGLSVQGSELYLGSVLFTPNTSSADLSGLATTVFGAAVSGVPYDLKRDGTINMTDFIEFAKQFNKKTNPDETPSAADFNGDGKVDMTDFIEFAKNFNKKKTDSLGLIPETGKSSSMAASLDCLSLTPMFAQEPISAVEPIVVKELVAQPEPVLTDIEDLRSPEWGVNKPEPIIESATVLLEDDSMVSNQVSKADCGARQDLYDNQTQDSFTILGAVRSADSVNDSESDSSLIPLAIDEALSGDSFWEDEDRYQLKDLL